MCLPETLKKLKKKKKDLCIFTCEHSFEYNVFFFSSKKKSFSERLIRFKWVKNVSETQAPQSNYDFRGLELL